MDRLLKEVCSPDKATPFHPPTKAEPSLAGNNVSGSLAVGHPPDQLREAAKVFCAALPAPWRDWLNRQPGFEVPENRPLLEITELIGQELQLTELSPMEREAHPTIPFEQIQALYAVRESAINLAEFATVWEERRDGWNWQLIPLVFRGILERLGPQLEQFSELFEAQKPPCEEVAASSSASYMQETAEQSLPEVDQPVLEAVDSSALGESLEESSDLRSLWRKIKDGASDLKETVAETLKRVTESNVVDEVIRSGSLIRKISWQEPGAADSEGKEHIRRWQRASAERLPDIIGQRPGEAGLSEQAERMNRDRSSKLYLNHPKLEKEMLIFDLFLPVDNSGRLKRLDRVCFKSPELLELCYPLGSVGAVDPSQESPLLSFIEISVTPGVASLPTHPDFTVTGVRFLDKEGKLVPTANGRTEIRESPFGSALVIIPNGVDRVLYQLQERSSPALTTEQLEQIKSALGSVPSYSSELERKFFGALQGAGLAADQPAALKSWVEAKRWIYTMDPAVAQSLVSIRDNYTEVLSGLRCGTCDPMATYAAIKLGALECTAVIGVGFSASESPEIDGADHRFNWSAGHALTVAYKSSGPEYVDLTSIAKRETHLADQTPKEFQQAFTAGLRQIKKTRGSEAFDAAKQMRNLLDRFEFSPSHTEYSLVDPSKLAYQGGVDRAALPSIYRGLGSTIYRSIHEQHLNELIEQTHDTRSLQELISFFAQEPLPDDQRACQASIKFCQALEQKLRDETISTELRSELANCLISCLFTPPSAIDLNSELLPGMCGNRPQSRDLLPVLRYLDLEELSDRQLKSLGWGLFETLRSPVIYSQESKERALESHDLVNRLLVPALEDLFTQLTVSKVSYGSNLAVNLLKVAAAFSNDPYDPFSRLLSLQVDRQGELALELLNGQLSRGVISESLKRFIRSIQATPAEDRFRDRFHQAVSTFVCQAENLAKADLSSIFERIQELDLLPGSSTIEPALLQQNVLKSTIEIFRNQRERFNLPSPDYPGSTIFSEVGDVIFFRRALSQCYSNLRVLDQVGWIDLPSFSKKFPRTNEKRVIKKLDSAFVNSEGSFSVSRYNSSEIPIQTLSALRSAEESLSPIALIGDYLRDQTPRLSRVDQALSDIRQRDPEVFEKIMANCQATGPAHYSYDALLKAIWDGVASGDLYLGVFSGATRLADLVRQEGEGRSKSDLVHSFVQQVVKVDEPTVLGQADQQNSANLRNGQLSAALFALVSISAEDRGNAREPSPFLSPYLFVAKKYFRELCDLALQGTASNNQLFSKLLKIPPEHLRSNQLNAISALADLRSRNFIKNAGRADRAQYARFIRERGRSSVLAPGGSEVVDLRPYAAGDDTKSVDWAATARSGRLISKVRMEREGRPVTILVDLEIVAGELSGIDYKFELSPELIKRKYPTLLGLYEHLHVAAKAGQPTDLILAWRGGIVRFDKICGYSKEPNSDFSSPDVQRRLQAVLSRARQIEAIESFFFESGSSKYPATCLVSSEVFGSDGHGLPRGSLVVLAVSDNHRTLTLAALQSQRHRGITVVPL